MQLLCKIAELFVTDQNMVMAHVMLVNAFQTAKPVGLGAWGGYADLYNARFCVNWAY